jgi:predicted ATP-dependent serine protease
MGFKKIFVPEASKSSKTNIEIIEIKNIKDITKAIATF